MLFQFTDRMVEENGKSPRKDAIYGKRYLEGKYGADPYIRKGLNWGSKL